MAGSATDETKVWKALGQDDGPAEPTGDDRALRPASSAPIFQARKTAGIVLGAVIVLAAAGWLAWRVRSVRPRNAARLRLEPEETPEPDDIQSIWKVHLRRKRRQRGPAV